MKSEKLLTETTDIKLTFPTCSLELFAVTNGVSLRIVQEWAKKDYIPTLKFGRHRVVNLAKLTLAIT